MNISSILKGKNAALLGAGFLIGSVGLKALTSAPAKRLYVQGVACGLRAKEAYEDVVEEAKAQVDDIVAEAVYLNAQQDVECECECCCDDAEDAAPANAAN